ncbi:MAG: thiamine-monophosphate kinase [Gammaproteobacteria bacterium]|jgi:thiamine-monophosphate kinase
MRDAVHRLLPGLRGTSWQGGTDVRLASATLLPMPPANTANLAICIDTMVDGVHFDERTSPADLGYKSLAVNLSDIAAMGARAHAASLSLCAPPELVRGRWLDEFAQGLLSLADEHSVLWRGGAVRTGPLNVTVEVLALSPAKSLRRDAARVGDSLYVSGTLGDAGCALTEDLSGLSSQDQAFLRSRLLRPIPRLALAQAIGPYANAGIDLSDGIASDIHHVTRASNVSAVIHTGALPLSPAMQRCVDSDAARRYALCAGDDYELLLSVPQCHRNAAQQAAQAAGCPLTLIGSITEPTDCEHVSSSTARARSVTWLDASGSPTEVGAGYTHFE